MTNWKEYKLSDLMDVIGGGTPKTTIPEYWGGDIPWLSVIDFGNAEKRVFDTEKKITDLGLRNSSTKILRSGQIIISARGTVGELAVLGRDMAFNQSCYGLNAKSEICTNDFLYYLMKCKISELKRNAHGAVFDTITRNTFDTVSTTIPDLPTQTAIAKILSSLDDKIELNNKINQELENLAQTLFKQWFIDFEFPNENGEPYKSAGGEMVESELGEIPKGWEVERLGDHLYIKGRIGWKGLKKSEYLQEFEGYSIVNGSDFLNEQIDYLTCGWIPKDRYDDSPEIQLQQNDILITKDGTIGKLAFVNKIEHPTSVASGVFVVRPNSNNVRTYFCWSFFKSPYFQSLVKSRIDGSVIPHLYQKDFVEMFIPLPPSNLLETFESQAQSLFELVFENKEEAKELSKLRDALLPKLISGELHVAEVEVAIA